MSGRRKGETALGQTSGLEGWRGGWELWIVLLGGGVQANHGVMDHDVSR